ncbi:hypothetical protein [Chelatococcus reniformis]|uniref:Uncharacterized protein n=1 Tax=Chelatococcus reniformis TaxID=1494448 RepID=A0A916UM98_9HYPH|nr:hypothetical protein [Chelatococcus reniformis]GGC77252.1 hypothetical protein GCM10010994_39460 [Chelatococcus reniformis]
MRLTAYDEFPFHQHPTPFHIPATSDVHFNDGYFCAAFADDWYVVAGVRLHPNMNVIDGFAGIARRGEQRVLRASRVLRPNAAELAVGPLRIDIREPMRKVTISLADNEADFAFDLTFEAKASPFLEAPYQFRKYGHLIHDLVRYTQICSATGTVRRGDETVAPQQWHAIRDHSWGVRAGMGPVTSHGGIEREEEEIDRRRFRVWAPFSLDRYTGFFNTHEDEDGRPLDFEGCLDMPDGSRLRLTGLRHKLDYAPGTKNVVGGTFELCDEHGRWRAYRIEAAGTPADVQGLGYYGGWRDGGSAGVYRGAGPVVETDRYPSAAHLGKTGLLSLPESKRLGPTEFPCVMTGPDGETGMVHFEQHVFGAYRPYGF